VIKSIIFDFDGVILDSVGLKSEVFFETFKEFGKDIAKKAVEYHENHGGISRFEKFDYINKKFLNSKLNENDLIILAEKFASIIKKKIFKAPFIKGSYEFISSEHSNYELHIATSTPQNEILDILKKKKIKQYFKQIYGSPLKKTKQVNKILSNSFYKKQEFLLVGDSIEDYKASIDNKVRFLGIKSKYTRFPAIDKIDNLFQIRKFLIK